MLRHCLAALVLCTVHARCTQLVTAGGRMSRAALLRGFAAVAGTTMCPSVTPAYDLPPLDAFDDKALRAKYAAMANPSMDKQASAAFYAITSGDTASLKVNTTRMPL